MRQTPVILYGIIHGQNVPETGATTQSQIRICFPSRLLHSFHILRTIAVS